MSESYQQSYKGPKSLAPNMRGKALDYQMETTWREPVQSKTHVGIRKKSKLDSTIILFILD